jgi:hypothetical protein
VRGAIDGGPSGSMPNIGVSKLFAINFRSFITVNPDK